MSKNHVARFNESNRNLRPRSASPRNHLKNLNHLEAVNLARNSRPTTTARLNSTLTQDYPESPPSSTATIEIDNSTSNTSFNNEVNLHDVNSDEEVTKNTKAKPLGDNLFVQKILNGELVHYCLLCSKQDEPSKPIKSSTGTAVSTYGIFITILTIYIHRNIRS